ncbi:MAG: FAD-binding protein, partial [Bacteroidales bacterium]|nr:FAD-binding protein [Bacteroidales bacterium]
MIKEFELNVLPEELVNAEILKKTVSKRTGIRIDTIQNLNLLKKSIDARKKPISYRIKVELSIIEENNPSEDITSEDEKTQNTVIEKYKDVHNAKPIIVVGAGPAGLFASLKLIEKGLKPIIIERGKPVSERKKDTAQIIRQKEINPESNWCFGEGGAGTFSDGKLYTRSNKRGNINEVLDIFVEHGADQEIRINAHAHIGTDGLSSIIKNIRKTIEDCGGEYHFETKVVDFIVNDNEIKGVITQKGDKIEAD